MSTPEGRVLKACMDYLRANGIAAWRINTMGTPLQGQPGRFRPAPSRGIADIIGIAPRIREKFVGSDYDVDGRMDMYADVQDNLPLAIEVKSAKGRQSPAQVDFARAWEEAGGIYIIARSVDELGAKLRLAGVQTRVR